MTRRYYTYIRCRPEDQARWNAWGFDAHHVEPYSEGYSILMVRDDRPSGDEGTPKEWEP